MEDVINFLILLAVSLVLGAGVYGLWMFFSN